MTTGDKKYFEAVGRRKEATARIRIYKSDKTKITVNDKDFSTYFKVPQDRSKIDNVLALNPAYVFEISARIHGGGVNAQSDAFRHGLARALLEVDPSMRGVLKKNGYLKRDPRAKERRKFGLKKARKAPQWSKR